MFMTDETLEQPTEFNPVLQAIAELSERLESFEKNTNAQLEIIREGLVKNSAAFDRLEAKVLNLRADVKELSEEVRQIRKESVL